MKIWTVMENTACRENLQAEHGLSLYIEFRSYKILFDTGQTDAFLKNARKMGIDLKAVDTVILSHGHYDHGGGLKYFLKENNKANIYVNQNAFEPHFNGAEKYIGLDPDLQKSRRLIFTGNEEKLDEGISLHTCNGFSRPYTFDSFGLNTEKNGVLYPDDFCHEQYLLLETGNRKILFSGCSHKGILNIVDWFRPDVLIGGFHLKKLNPLGRDAEILEKTARILLDYPTVYYTCHCTGLEQFRFLKERMNDRLFYLPAGSELTVPDESDGSPCILMS